MSESGVWLSLLVLAVGGMLLACIPASIAGNKGRSFLGYWLFGLFAFLPALIVALVIQPTPEGEDLQYRRAGRLPCRYCREYIREDASVCPHCRREEPFEEVEAEYLDRWDAFEGTVSDPRIGAVIVGCVEGATNGQLRSLVAAEDALRASDEARSYEEAERVAGMLALERDLSAYYGEIREECREMSGWDLDAALLDRVATIAARSAEAYEIRSFLQPAQCELLLRPWRTVFGALDSGTSSDGRAVGAVPVAGDGDRCRNCGAGLPEGARYCGACGAKQGPDRGDFRAGL